MHISYNLYVTSGNALILRYLSVCLSVCLSLTYLSFT